MRVLGVETSCDETSAAIVEGDGTHATLRSLVIVSQDVHRLFGGVVPEIASRAHLTSLVPAVRQALLDANLTAADIDAIAVTHGPGLVGALLVGTSWAKAYGATLEKPVLGVHHMEGHLFAPSLEDANAEPPFTALLVSGGHTLLLDVEAWGAYRLLGATRDDAAGEAFDKVAKLLGLPYPGGPHIERLAATASDVPKAFKFTRPLTHGGQRLGDADYFDVSFSGLKTAVLNAVKGSDDIERDRALIARGFQDALTGTLAEKVARAVTAHGRTRVVLGGGVACYKALVAAIQAKVGRGVTVHAPSPRLATDNAAMIARAGLWRLARGERSGDDLSAFASLPLPGLVAA
jgi:N6-L-threonylcarbamoyladenine synthase